MTLGGTQDNGVPGRVGTDDWFTSNLFADGFVCNINPFNARNIKITTPADLELAEALALREERRA